MPPANGPWGAVTTGEAVPGATPTTPTTPNAIGATLGLLGDEWTLQVVRFAFAGVRRYGDWKDRLGIADAVLAARLTTLVDAGVLSRHAYSDQPPRFEYQLTDSGVDLWPLLLSIWSWELQYVPGQSSRLPRMVHRTCGAAFEPVLHCARCHQPVGVDDVEIGLGPSGAFERSIPVGMNRRRSSTRSAAGPTAGMFPETMALIGSRWSSAMLGAAFLGATRFRDFVAMIGAPPNIVAERLRTFTDLGVLDAVRIDGRADRSTYHLTVKGRAFFPAVATFLAWGERWRPAADGPAIVATHRRCGRTFVPELACSACDVALVRRAVVVVPDRSSIETIVTPRKRNTSVNAST